MARMEDQRPKAGGTCGVRDHDATRSDRSGWLMAIPLIGVFFCCGVPAIGALLASAGILAVLGSWWAGAGHWIVIGVAVAAAAGFAGWIWWRRRRLVSS
ncbi:MAG: hypothetical protein OWU33_11920 [Firmicutes bacterium]|nr:hypothetical protein [Bacillota bacterium]